MNSLQQYEHETVEIQKTCNIMIFKIYKRRGRDEIYDNYKFYQILPALCLSIENVESNRKNERIKLEDKCVFPNLPHEFKELNLAL